MIEWFDPLKQLPEDGQECLLMGHAQDGLITQAVFGPIMWRAKDKIWIDIFRDPEAGTLINVDQVGAWCLWDPIKPKEGSGLPTPWPEGKEPKEETEVDNAGGA